MTTTNNEKKTHLVHVEKTMFVPESERVYSTCELEDGTTDIHWEPKWPQEILGTIIGPEDHPITFFYLERVPAPSDCDCLECTKVMPPWAAEGFIPGVVSSEEVESVYDSCDDSERESEP